MIQKVVFFNFYHNGDIHISRNFVKVISDICFQRGITCEYYHKNNPSILADVPHVTHTTNQYNLHDRFPTSIVGDTLFFNTWYCADMNIFNRHSISFDCLYLSFKEGAKLLGIDLSTVHGLDLFPNIDFSYCQIDKAKEWLSSHTNKKVFFSNGNVLSGQAHNFSFVNIINNLAKEYNSIDFLISNNESGFELLPNIYFTSNIIQKDGCDLNENSYLTNHCDLIVGRCSGTYSFAMTRENYWNNPKTFLAFTNIGFQEVVWTKNYTPVVAAKIIAHNVFDHRVEGLIKDVMPKK